MVALQKTMNSMLSSPGTSFRSISVNGGYRLALHDSTLHLESLYRRAGFQGLLLLIRNAVLGWNRSAFRAGRENKGEAAGHLHLPESTENWPRQGPPRGTKEVFPLLLNLEKGIFFFFGEFLNKMLTKRQAYCRERSFRNQLV